LLPTLRSLDDVRALVARLRPSDAAAAAAARAREPQLTKPPGALARLEDIAEWLAAWQGRHPPSAARVSMLVFAANHGIARQGVSAFPIEVTRQMVLNFERGGAAINQLCRVGGIELSVIDAGVDAPTEDFSQGPAMDADTCLRAIRLGADSVPECDLVCVGEMGIGNTTAAAAICTALLGGGAADWVGAGTGVTGPALTAKIRIVDASVARHRAQITDGLEALRHVGGKEIAAICGVILAARERRIPVVLDGYVTGAAACVLHAINAEALAHCIAGHVSAEPGHRRLLARLGMAPLLDLGLRLGEGTGAALAVCLIRGAAACHTGMATFGEAGVSDKS
jgi:nicotinate-nucleotide--dimethylbenzimidazole phosphoribosyltransferase